MSLDKCFPVHVRVIWSPLTSAELALPGLGEPRHVLVGPGNEEELHLLPERLPTEPLTVPCTKQHEIYKECPAKEDPEASSCLNRGGFAGRSTARSASIMPGQEIRYDDRVAIVTGEY
jgi:hypothetical protein